MPGLLIRNVAVLVVPESGECHIAPAQDIHVEDGQIAAITPTNTPTGSPSDPTSGSSPRAVGVVGAGVREVVDGIWPMEVNLTPERVRVGARLACAEMLLAGVTTFVDHYFHADQIAAAVIESGIRGPRTDVLLLGRPGGDRRRDRDNP